MPTTRELKRRIDSVTNTRKITSAMRMVAAAKLNRSQQNARQAQPYAQQLSQTLKLLPTQHPFFQKNHSSHPSLILLTTDRGLAGAFNSQINKAAYNFLNQQQTASLAIFGRKGQDFFRSRTQTSLSIHSTITQIPMPERTRQLDNTIAQLSNDFLKEKTSGIWLAYNRFYNPLKQLPELRQILPIVPENPRKTSDIPPPPVSSDTSAEAQVILEPSPKKLESILSDYLINQAYIALLETEAGEHGARMVAMEAATKNAGEMINSLTLQYNRLRQAAITSELIEIINGAQAL